MTTYYIYNGQGQLSLITTDIPRLLVADSNHQIGRHVQAGTTDIVGDYLRQRAATDAPEQRYFGNHIYGTASSTAVDHHIPYSTESRQSRSIHRHTQDSFSNRSIDWQASNKPHPTNCTQNARRSSVTNYRNAMIPQAQYGFNPDPDLIRKDHTLHSFQSHIQREQKMKALEGPFLDIIEQETGDILAHGISKNMLALFIGHDVMDKYICTVERADSVKCDSQAIAEELKIPRLLTTKSALRILIGWMIRACKPATMDRILPFRIPQHMPTACMLAQTCQFFQLYKDTRRVEIELVRNHFRRPIFAVELEALWAALGPENKFTVAVMKVMGCRLREIEADRCVLSEAWLEIDHLLDKEPLLRKRLREVADGQESGPPFPVVGSPYGGRSGTTDLRLLRDAGGRGGGREEMGDGM